MSPHGCLDRSGLHPVQLAQRLRTCTAHVQTTLQYHGDRVGSNRYTSRRRRSDALACRLRSRRWSSRRPLAQSLGLNGSHCRCNCAHEVVCFLRSLARADGGGWNPQLVRGRVEPAAAIPAILGRHIANPRRWRFVSAFLWSVHVKPAAGARNPHLFTPPFLHCIFCTRNLGKPVVKRLPLSVWYKHSRPTFHCFHLYQGEVVMYKSDSISSTNQIQSSDLTCQPRTVTNLCHGRGVWISPPWVRV